MDNCEVNKCFDSLIGVYGCHNEGECRYFVNDIPGISNELLDNITDGERGSYLQVFQKALTAAINTLMIDVQDILLNDKDRAEFGGELYRSQQPRVSFGTIDITLDRSFVGVLMLTASSKYVVAEIGSVSLMPTQTVTLVPVIFDYESKQEIERGDPIEAVGGQLSDFDFDYRIDCSKHRAVFFGFEIDSDAPVNFARMSCNRFEKPDCNTCEPCEAICSDGQQNDFRRVMESVDLDHIDEFTIYNVSAADLADFDTYTELQSHSAVMCAGVSLVCSIGQFVCENNKRLAPGLQYLVAYNILTAKMGSFRQNMWAKGNLEFTAMLRDELKKDYLRSMKKIVPKLPLSGVSLCWECKSVGVTTESLI